MRNSIIKKRNKPCFHSRAARERELQQADGVGLPERWDALQRHEILVDEQDVAAGAGVPGRLPVRLRSALLPHASSRAPRGEVFKPTTKVDLTARPAGRRCVVRAAHPISSLVSLNVLWFLKKRKRRINSGGILGKSRLLAQSLGGFVT